MRNKPCLVIAVTLLVLSHVLAFAQNKPDSPVAKDPVASSGSPVSPENIAAKKLDLPKAVEIDARVQSDGKAWGITHAKITDPVRPRVLLIGDSILNGYLSRATKRLDGIAYVDGWVNPYCQSEAYNKQLEKVLTALGPYDVVHFNMGLHGFQNDRKVKGSDEKLPRIPVGQFEPLTKAFVEVIKRVNPKAKIIWASTTQISLRDKPTELDPVNNPLIIEHNRLAAKVMAEMQVPINDFYALMASHADLKANAFHWNEGAKKIQGDACADAVIQALKEKAAQK